MYLTSAEKGKREQQPQPPPVPQDEAAKAQNKHHQVTYTNTQLTWANDDVVRPVLPVATFAKWRLWEINFLRDTLLYYSKSYWLTVCTFSWIEFQEVYLTRILFGSTIKLDPNWSLK